jgi:hypothetical protein
MFDRLMSPTSPGFHIVWGVFTAVVLELVHIIYTFIFKR